MSKGVSIIICCFNSAKRLPETLRHIAKQRVEDEIPWEVIVVNNNSSDNTADVASDEWAKYLLNIPFKVVYQPIPGLSFAREKGIESANFEYLLFCDDDNWLCETYVADAYTILSNHPDVALVGGNGEYVCEGEQPKWFDEFSGPYATGKQLATTGYAAWNITFYGAGAIVSKTDYINLEKEGFKFFLSGREGKKLLTGEDRELGYAFILNNKKLYYSEKLKFKHFIPKERHTYRYYSNMMYNCIPASIILYCYYLCVLNKTTQRPVFKKSYLWGLLMMTIQSIKHYCSVIIPYLRKGYWKFLLMETNILFKSCIYWVANKKQFVETFNRISNAEFNK